LRLLTRNNHVGHQALRLLHDAYETLKDMGECPAEILIGFYYLLGFLYERRGKFAKAIRAFEISLGIMERVYGTLCELVSESRGFV
jgi:tetratricopeptide (TPR) repeat protein